MSARRVAVFGGQAAGLRLERVRASQRFVDGQVRNSGGVGPGIKGSPLPLLGESFRGGQARVPKGPLPLLDPRPGWQRPAEQLRVITPRLGGSLEPSRVEHSDPWWREV
ncbi:MAG: hypothetical protein M3Y59_02920 [Myxococcota bacterium]|nr:hypothetical protein [Myxococcota bacterium]